MASGLSHRFRDGNKLLAEVEGIPLVRRVVSAYLDGGLEPVFAVLGHDASAVRDAISALQVTIVPNPGYREGQSRSLVRGVLALPDWIAAAVIGVGDQPYLTGEVIRGLVDLYAGTGMPLVVPRYGGQRGNPVLFDRSLFDELAAVTGDRGGRSVVQAHPREIAWLDGLDPRAGLDIDTDTEYERVVAETSRD